MGSSSVNEVSTSGRTNESDIEGEVGLKQFLGFLGQLVSNPPGSGAFREFCKAKAAVGGKCGKCVEFAGRGIDESISLEYFDGDVWSDLSEGFLYYISQLENGLSLPLTNLAKGILNAIGACPVQLNNNMWEVARLVKGIWLSIEEEKSELKKTNVGLKKELARSRADALKEVRQLKASHVVVIGQLQVETKANLGEMVKERDRLGHHLMLKGYSEEEVDAIKADTYIEEEDGEEAEVVVREMSLRINNLESGLARERKTAKALLSAQAELQVRAVGNEMKIRRKRRRAEGSSRKSIGFRSCSCTFKREMQRRCNDLNERVARLKAELAQTIARARKAKAREHLGGSRTEGYVQKGNTNLRECQHKLDAALIREKVLEGEIKAKELLVKRKKELLKDMPARVELNGEIGRLHARVVDLEVMNLAESVEYINKLEENVIYHAKIDAEMTELKNRYARLESHLERLRARFATMVIPDASRSNLLKAIVAYFVEEVKKLESKRDTLLKTLSDKGCICGAKIDRGNCLSVMETQLALKQLK
ncbi:hypothetical protein GIB67_008872 [Kingdonia uniflora]|uniref:Uncharacterized protein n=1 Tax=Kingdonia uniflora TaxID=39325 RepID=A0A7J7LVB1_9MAGN|nr:hypothetical protein GIB67_008872 [Kingdonia uniflora]